MDVKTRTVDRWRVAIEILALCVAVALLLLSRTRREGVFQVWGVALAFLAAMALTLEGVLRFSMGQMRGFTLQPLSDIASAEGLDPKALLTSEFEYARTTASEAMNDRHTVVNFYLLLTGVVVSAVVALINAGQPGSSLGRALPLVAMALLWALCIVGWLYLLQIIRLRQAWRDSALTMNKIKEFCIARVALFSPQDFSQAFRWRLETLPPAGKLWTIHFFSAALIALLNSLVYVGGALLYGLSVGLSPQQWVWAAPGLALLGVVLFALALHMYVVFLRRNA
jgi:hypothetical protein